MDLDEAAQRGLKTGDFLGAMAAHGVNLPEYDYYASPLYSRRRATLTGRRTKKGAQIGFLAAATHDVVDQHMCLILSPGIFALRPTLLAMMPIVASRSAMVKFHITEVDNGFDLAVDNAKNVPPENLAALAALAAPARIIRVMLGDEMVYQADVPWLDMAGVRVELPRRPFLQATRDGEARLRAHVHEFAGARARVADLFAGLGTFSYGIDARVDAFEGDQAMIGQLTHNANINRRNNLRGIYRDLFRDPLLAKELSDYDAVIIDPPRHGAEAQARALADSNVARIAYVSCNAQSFARDAAMLQRGGYVMTRLALVDQFRFAKHLESVALFVK